MSNFNAFMRRDLEGLMKEYVVSDRFVGDDGKVIKFKLRPMPPAQERILTKDCRKVVDGVLVFDAEKYERELTSHCVVYPDLKNVELQDFYGVSSEEDLLDEMLLVGEKKRLQLALEDINGLKDVGAKVEEAKN